jgi:hypothetical protein
MQTKHKAMAAAAALALGGYLYWRSRKSKLVCGDGATFKPATAADVASYSQAVRDQVAKHGGYCVRGGFVSEPTTSSYEGLDGPVTSPANYNPF